MLKKLFLYQLILIIFLLCPIYAAEPNVEIIGEKLSLHADQIPLQNILQEIADLGVKVRVDPELNPEISASFENRDIQKGLASVLKSLNHVLVWEPLEIKPGRIFKLTEIQIFRPGEKERMKSLGRTSSGFSVAKNPKDGSLYVRNEILLKLKPGSRISDFKGLLAQIRGTVIDKNAAAGIYRIRLPKDADVPEIADLISKHSGIGKAEPNYAYYVPVPSEFSQLSGDISEFSLPDGKVPVAVLDTGLSPYSGLGDAVLSSLDAVNPDEPISDSQGHGTQMALIAAGIVKPYGAGKDADSYAPVIPIKAFDEDGYTSNFAIMRSIDFAAENGARVMSLSWGSETRSEFLEDAFDYADSKGLIIVGAAGNNPTGTPFYPAAYDSVIGVGALAPDGTTWEKSNYGSFVTVSAPGFANLPVGYKGDPGAYAGTSIATAFVSNRIADYLSEHPRAAKQEVFHRLNEIVNNQ